VGFKLNDFSLFIIFLLVIAIAFAISYLVLDKILFPILIRLSDRIADSLLNKKKVNKKRTLLIAEILFIVVTVCTLFCLIYIIIRFNQVDVKSGGSLFLLTMLLYSIFIMVESSIVIKIKKELGKGQYDSILENSFSRINPNYYLFNRLSLLFGRTTISFVIHLVFVNGVLVGASEFNQLPYQTYYFVMVSIPVSLVSWIYLTSTDKTEQSVRRILVYALVLILVFMKSFTDFQILMEVNNRNPFTEYMMVLLLAIFIGIDRLIKSIIDDYRDFTKEKKKR
jgi:hypothetical protein